MAAPQLICFDLDGPLLDVSGRYYQLYSDLVVELGGQPMYKMAYWTKKRNKVPETVILTESGLAMQAEKYNVRRLSLIEEEEYLRLDCLWPGTLHFLEKLSAVAPLILVTLRSRQESLLWQLETLGLRPFFRQVLSVSGRDAVVDKAELKAGLVKDAWDSCYGNGWFVGDTETDLRAGKLLKLKTLAVTFGIRATEHLIALGPDLLIDHPDQLHRWGCNLITTNA